MMQCILHRRLPPLAVTQTTTSGTRGAPNFSQGPNHQCYGRCNLTRDDRCRRRDKHGELSVDQSSHTWDFHLLEFETPGKSGERSFAFISVTAETGISCRVRDEMAVLTAGMCTSHWNDRVMKEGRQFPASMFADRKSTRLNSSHSGESRMPSSA